MGKICFGSGRPVLGVNHLVDIGEFIIYDVGAMLDDPL
jgi:hypothetical protein